MPAFANVTVLGAGVLGAQIAFQAANHGKTVTAYDVDDAALEAARGRLDAIVAQYVGETGEDSRESATSAAAGITLTSDLAVAVADADLVIEAVPESLELKQDVYRRIAEAAPERTVFATNSSTLLPSAIADATGRPDRFLALHFANHVWRQNTAEIMGTPATSPEVFDRVVAFAEEIGMVPIPLKKEQPGYVLNSLLVPLLNAASQLYVDGVADVETIDKTWRIGTGAPAGPFQIFDVVGLTTAYNISSVSQSPKQRAFAALIKERFIDQGKLGVATGEGFYRYTAA